MQRNGSNGIFKNIKLLICWQSKLQSGEPMDRWNDGSIGSIYLWFYESMDGWFDGLMDGWMDGSMHWSIDLSIDISIEWMMDGWMDGWMDGSNDLWIDGLMDR